MKKKLLLFALMLASFTSAFARVEEGEIMSIANVRNIVQGYEGSFDIVLNNTNTKLFTAFGMDVQLPEGFTFIGCEAGPLLTDHQLMTSDQGSNITRISALSFSNDPAFTAITGTVLKIRFSVGATAASGTARVFETDFASVHDDQGHHPTDATADLTVSSTVTLDESNSLANVALNNVQVSVDRTIPAGKWSTICLPFPLTEAQVAANFGTSVQIGDFNGYTMDGDNIKVIFLPVTSMAAHHPYIIKVSSDVDGISALVDISYSTALNNNKGTEKKPKAFIGTYETIQLDEGCLYLKDNTFKYSNGKAKLKPYRGYFNFTDFDPEAPARVFLDFEEPTGVKHVEALSADETSEIFGLDGRRMSASEKGVRIVNGKKVINK